ncbi:MAG: hypothetical protein ABGX43_06675 [Nitrospinaceae bacterium]|jgi:hypothetical protein|nr:hypothetical protein [Nitrospinaceae bacterium]
MLQKIHITLCASIAGLFSVLFSPYTAVANDGKELPCDNIRLLNKASQELCRAKGWGTDTKGRWVQMKGEKELKTSGIIGDAKKKVPEQKIYWTEGKRIRSDHMGHLPKGGWR